MKRCDVIVLFVGICANSANFRTVFADEAGFGSQDRVRIDAGVIAAQAAHRKHDVETVVARLLGATNYTDQHVLMSSLKSLDLTADEGLPIYRQLLKIGSPTMKQLTLSGIGRYGTVARGLSSELLEIINDPTIDPNVLARAVAAVVQIIAPSPETVSAIANLLERSRPDHVNVAIMAALRRMGPPAVASISKIESFLSSLNSAVEFQAFSAIGEIKGAPDRMLPQAIGTSSLDGLSLEEQYGALKSMQDKGLPVQRPTVALLLKCLDDKRPYIQAMALQSLAVAGRSDKEAVGAVLLRVGADDEFISRTAAEALGNIDANNVELIDVLAGGLTHEHQKVRHSAAKALKRFGIASKAALPALATALRDAHRSESHFQIGAYLEVIKGLGPEGREAAPMILSLLSERALVYRNRDKFNVHYLRAFMLLTLSEIEVPDEAAPFIIDALANSDGSMVHLYAAAAQAAVKLPGIWQQSLPFLTRALSPDFADHPLTFESYYAAFSRTGQYTCARIEAIRALGAIGSSAKSATPLLEKVAAEAPPFLGDNSPIKIEATKALLSINK